MTPNFRPYLAAAAVILLAACTTVSQPAPKAPSQLVVSNSSTGPCDMYVQGDYVSSVPGATAVVLSNLPGNDYSFTASCQDGQIKKEISPSGMPQVDLPGQATAVEDRTATLLATNPTGFDVELEMNGELLGRVFADSSSAFPNVPAGEKELLLRELIARGEWPVSVNLSPKAVTRLEIKVPLVSLQLRNDSAEKVRITIHDNEPVAVPAGEKTVIEGLPPGTSSLLVEYINSGRKLDTSVEIAPGATRQLELSSQAGTIRVANDLTSPTVVYVNGKRADKVEPGQQLNIPGVPPGKAEVRVVADTGPIHIRTFEMVPGSTQTWVLNELSGEVAVTNAIGENITLLIDGNRAMQMAPNDTSRIPTTVGAHKLAARCEITGFQQELDIVVEGGVGSSAVFGPQPGRIFVENRTLGEVDLFRNGYPLGRLTPGQALEFGGQPLGKNLLEVMTTEKELLLRKELVTSPEAPLAPPVVLTETTISISVAIKNETGEPVKLDPMVIADSHIVQPGTEVTVKLQSESGVLKMVGVDSKTRYDRNVRAQPGESTRIVLAPSVGGIAISNNSQQLLEVLLDEQPFALLEPGESQVAENVGPGKHILSALADGKQVAQTSCILVENSWFVWKVTLGEATLRIVNRAGEELAVRINGQAAGKLPDGSDSTLEKLPSGKLEISATGLASNIEYRFAMDDRPQEDTTWTVRPSSGGVRLWGLGGLETEVFVDGSPREKIPADASEPVYVPLEPGEHAIRVGLSDGTTAAALVSARANLFAEMHVKDAAPSVEARNRSGGAVELWLDGAKLDDLPDGEDRLIPLHKAGIHNLRAVRPGTGQEWQLKEVFFKETGRFGWTLAPVDRSQAN